MHRSAAIAHHEPMLTMGLSTVYLYNKEVVAAAVISEMFRLALESAAAFQSLVAMSQAMREALITQDTNKNLSPEVLHLRGQSLQDLRQDLMAKSTIDESIMLTGLNLMTLDVCTCPVVSRLASYGNMY